MPTNTVEEVSATRIVAFEDSAVVCDSTEELSDEQHFNAYRMRWIQRLEKRTGDSALKSRLLESLEEAYRTPVSVLSEGELGAVKGRFLEDALSPVQFLDELQSLLCNK